MAWSVGIGAHAQPFVAAALRTAVPDLRPVDHPLITLTDRAGAKAGEVGAGVRLGIADRADQLTPGDRRKELALVLLGAVPHDHRRHRRDSQVGPGHARVLELPHQQVLMHGTESEAAVFGRPGDAAPALLTAPAANRGPLAPEALQAVLV